MPPEKKLELLSPEEFTANPGIELPPDQQLSIDREQEFPPHPPNHSQLGERELPPHPANGKRLGERELPPHPFNEQLIETEQSPQRGNGRQPLTDREAPPHPTDGRPLPNVWIYEGDAYDLTEFIIQHPGGQFFIGRTKNRDITTIVNIFHPNPEKVKRRIQQYALDREARPEDIHPKYNAPPFLFKEDFNGWKDTPKYSFENKEQLINKIKNRVNQSEFKQKIARQDSLFDLMGILLFCTYLITQWLFLDSNTFFPAYVFVPAIVILRTALAGIGHYLIHRPQVGINKVLANIFDINYVPLALVVTDGHTLLHHPFTQTEVDIKKSVFTAILELPRYYRVPVHSFHKIGHLVIGMFIRIADLFLLTFKIGAKDLYGSWQFGVPHFLGSFGIHVLLLAELVLFSLNGAFGIWLLQFVITLWISTFMIVASHDFEHRDADDETGIEIDWSKKDWAVEQIRNAYDLTMVGNKYIDCFLSAGLSPHRVHHVLPQQRSGFANILSEDIVREEAEKFGIKWAKPKNFFIERLPLLFNNYLAVPSRMAKENDFGILKEHFHPQALLKTIDYAFKGWTGVGSI
jgi:Cytochrome b5-like Heme/Steroid binding domain